MSLIKRNQEKRKDSERLFKKIKKQVQGITLIALVVTVIVLLILAGVAISLTLGDNGLFKRAQNAVDIWEIAEENEQKEMDKASNFIEDYMNGNGGSGTVGDLKPGEGEEVTILDETTEVEDGLENKVVIPGGFGIASDSGTNVEDGIVIEDEDGNQFVWIPVSVLDEETGEKTPIHTSEGDIIIDYTRIDFEKQTGSYSDYSETMPTDEIESVNANGGYYIGRYEAGDGSSTEFRTSETDGTVVIKKNQVPYNYITRSDAETKATEMSTVQEYTTAITKLVSSYAWDTALDFIQKVNSDNEHSDYATSSPEGNYYDTEFYYANLGEAEKNSYKNENTETLIPTGQTAPVSNIYDIGGNLWEFNTESYSNESIPYVSRGGSYNNDYDNIPAGYRNYSIGLAYSNTGFRTTLYCSTES